MTDVGANIDLATRRALVATTTTDGNPASPPAVNGIDYLEVSNVVGVTPEDDRSELVVRFVHPVLGPGSAPTTPPDLSATSVTISGGDRVRDPAVTAIEVAGSTMRVHVAEIGDHSTYRLELDNSTGWLDPQLAGVHFAFLVECPTRFDCAGGVEPLWAPPPAPRLDLLARDYQSFRRLMLDRMAVTVPTWIERNPADLGVAVVELLAHLGDKLAYEQDVVATEAYLDRARFRTSVARHLRLVDYHLHDGHNARTWMAIEVTAEVQIGRRARFWTAVDGQPAVTSSIDVFDDAVAAGAQFFEAIADAELLPAHNRIEIHSWAETVDVLPAGSTSATLRNPHATVRLAPGSYVLFEDTTPTDAARRRQVVRLTSVEPGLDPLDRSAGNSGMRLVHVTWSAQDALHVDFPIGAGRCVARANLVLVDHGRTERVPITVGRVSDDRFRPPAPVADLSNASVPFHRATVPANSLLVNDLNAGRVGARLRAELGMLGVDLVGADARLAGTDRWVISDHQWLVAVELVDDEFDIGAGPLAAGDLMRTDPRKAQHAIALFTVDEETETSGPWIGERPNRWDPVDDVIRAAPDDRVFVVEVESDGRATLRFGDDESGQRPNVGTAFDATVRTGNGTAGNVGAESIRHLLVETGEQHGTTDIQTVFGPSASIVAVRNPIAASGGMNPETVEEARIRAPLVFTEQRRAVTPADYVARLEAHPFVQRASVRREWTGSWSTLFCTVDLFAGRTLDPRTEEILRRWVEPWRTMGHDVEIDEPLLVPVEIELCVGIGSATPRQPVFADVLERLGNGLRSDGTPGLFHPDRRSFGDRIYLSAIVAECQSVPGVVEVDVGTLRRLGSSDSVALERGYLQLFGREVAVLANDPNRPELGSLTVDVVGGR